MKSSQQAPQFRGLGKGTPCHVLQVHLQVVVVCPVAAVIRHDVWVPQGPMLHCSLKASAAKSPEAAHQIDFVLQLHLGQNSNPKFKSTKSATNRVDFVSYSHVFSPLNLNHLSHSTALSFSSGWRWTSMYTSWSGKSWVFPKEERTWQDP